MKPFPQGIDRLGTPDGSLDNQATSHAMSRRTKWNAVAAAIGFPVLAVLVLLSISLVRPLNFGIGKAHFSAGTREGWTLAPGGITDGEILKFPNQNIYSWHVRIGKRKLWTCSLLWDKTK